jgi:hypothetical protein
MITQEHSRTGQTSVKDSLVRPISTYRYALFAERESKGPIFVYGQEKELIGQIYFHPDTADCEIPKSTMDKDKVVDLHYRDSKFTDVIDLLRYEDEKLLIWIDGMNSRISTGI